MNWILIRWEGWDVINIDLAWMMPYDMGSCFSYILTTFVQHNTKHSFPDKKKINLTPNIWLLKVEVNNYCSRSLQFPRISFSCWKKNRGTIRRWYSLPGKRWIRTLTILSTELKTKLQRQTIKAHAKGPCKSSWIRHKFDRWIIL